jgi:hypothetical protein
MSFVASALHCYFPTVSFPEKRGKTMDEELKALLLLMAVFFLAFALWRFVPFFGYTSQDAERGAVAHFDAGLH